MGSSAGFGQFLPIRTGRMRCVGYDNIFLFLSTVFSIVL